MITNDKYTLLLGEIKGKLDALHTQVGGMDGKLDDVGKRVGRLEIKAASHGAMAGGFVAVGIAVITEKLKRTIGI